MNPLLQDHPLAGLLEKVEAGERLTTDNALQMFESHDLNALATIASLTRERKAGNRATFIVNRYLNYSNYCILSCQFCSFARKKRDGNGFELTLDQMVTKAREALNHGITELHIVGGLHPSLPFRYYTDLLRALKALDPQLMLKCFTAVEILHFQRLTKKTTREILTDLQEAGLDSLTGGGAEIFEPNVRNAIARGKETAEEWAEVHRTWHQLGGRSTCTMLFGHVESLADRVDHLRQLRTLQDETGGFTGFIPLPFQPENNPVPVDHPPSGFDILRTIAISRAFLDNIDHLTAYWVGLGLPLAQVALSYGADDLHGTIEEEHIFHMAGAVSPQAQTITAMVAAIREAGRVPMQRDTFYQPLREWTGDAEAAHPKPSRLLKENLATA
ncbi:MAG: aminofutalosine synthase MqnE [Verrucomicrobiota bacterium]|nr:aminofutalosine synthase MqnE [Verrucomicrobiota bacterium]